MQKNSNNNFLPLSFTSILATLTTFSLLYFRTKFLKWILQSYFLFPLYWRFGSQYSSSHQGCLSILLFFTPLWYAMCLQPPTSRHALLWFPFSPCFPPTSLPFPSQSPFRVFFLCLSLKISPQPHTHTQNHLWKKDFSSHLSYYSWADYLKCLFVCLSLFLTKGRFTSSKVCMWINNNNERSVNTETFLGKVSAKVLLDRRRCKGVKFLSSIQRNQ